MGVSDTHQVESSTVLRNQPWDDQVVEAKLGNC
jgi:hypothetical protein